MLSTIVILSARVLCGFFNFTKKKKKIINAESMRGQAGEFFWGCTDRWTAGNSDCFSTAHSHMIPQYNRVHPSITQR